MTGRTTYALLGLGEAGRAFAGALGGTAEVRGWDPFVTGPLPGVEVAASALEATRGADAVLAFTTAAHSEQALAGVVGDLESGTLYGDFATADPAMKRRLGAAAEDAGLRFADVAIMAPVRRGADRVPLMLSGTGAPPLGALLRQEGLSVEVLEGGAGTAAARKLLRSMLIKGLTGVLIESLRAAEVEGLLDWFSDHAVSSLSGLDRDVLAGFLDGTRQHSGRRIEEMLAAASMAEQAGATADITRAVADVLRSVEDAGIPVGAALDV